MSSLGLRLPIPLAVSGGLAVLVLGCSDAAPLVEGPSSASSENFYVVEPLPEHVAAAGSVTRTRTGLFRVSSDGTRGIGFSSYTTASGALGFALVRFNPEEGTVEIATPPVVAGLSEVGVNVMATSADVAVALIRWSDADGVNHVFRYAEGAGLTELTPPYAVDRFKAGYLSDDGSIGAVKAVMPDERRVGLRVTEEGGLEDMGVLDSSGEMRPIGVSGDGTVVGIAASGSHPIHVQYTPELGLESLSTPRSRYCEDGIMSGASPVIAASCEDVPFVHTDALGWTPIKDVSQPRIGAVSHDGSAVIGSAVDDTGAYFWHWTEASGVTKVSSARVHFAEPEPLSDDGHVVAGLRWRLYDGALRGFIWSADHGMVDLGPLQPSSVSADGTRIAGPSFSAEGVPPAVASPDGTIVPLRTVLTSAGANPGSASITTVYVSRSGDTLWGASTVQGARRAWLARVPRSP